MQSRQHREASLNARQDFSVAIIGGGMCGLTLAIALARAGLRVDLFESRGGFGDVGASVTIGANATRALDLMGLLEPISEFTGDEPHDVKMHVTINHNGVEEELDSWDDDQSPKDLSLHRVGFLKALIPLFPSERVHFDKACSDVSHSASTGRYQVHFEDGTHHEADLVIGADGIRSVVRKAVVQGVAELSEHTPEEFAKGSRFEEDKNLMFTGMKLYRAMIPYDKLKEDGLKSDVQRMKVQIGDKGNLFSVPIKNGSIINVAAFSDFPPPVPGERMEPLPMPWVVKDISNPDVRKSFPGWSDDAHIILRNMGTSSYWALHSMGPLLKTFVRGRVMVIGDAAHASTPFLAAGVGQGIEDCHMLWKLLSDPRANRKNLEGILQAFDTIRVPRASHVVIASGDVPCIYHKILNGNLSRE